MEKNVEAKNNEVEVEKALTTKEKDSSGPNARKASAMGDGEDLELDYNDDVTGTDDVMMDEDALLYGDLGFADDEQVNPNANKMTEQEEVEEGEILDDDLFGTTKDGDDNDVQKLLKSPDKLAEDDVEIDDAEIDDAIDNAMSIVGLDTESEITSDQNEATDSNR